MDRKPLVTAADWREYYPPAPPEPPIFVGGSSLGPMRECDTATDDAEQEGWGGQSVEHEGDNAR